MGGQARCPLSAESPATGLPPRSRRPDRVAKQATEAPRELFAATIIRLLSVGSSVGSFWRHPPFQTSGHLEHPGPSAVVGPRHAAGGAVRGSPGPIFKSQRNCDSGSVRCQELRSRSATEVRRSPPGGCPKTTQTGRDRGTSLPAEVWKRSRRLVRNQPARSTGACVKALGQFPGGFAHRQQGDKPGCSRNFFARCKTLLPRARCARH